MQDFEEAKRLFLKGLEFQQMKSLAEAESMYMRSLEFLPDRPSTLLNLSLVQFEQGKIQEAKKAAERIILVDPDNAAALTQTGAIYLKLGLYDLAISRLKKAIALNPNHYEAHNVCGNVLRELNRLDEALACYERAIALNPGYAEAYSNSGNILKELERFDEALAKYVKAIALNPDYAEAFSNRGNALKEMKRLDEALASYDKAIALKPDFAEAYSNRGSALNEIKRLDEALASYDKAIALQPDFFEAQSNLAKLPKGIVPYHLASLLLQQWVCPSDKLLEAKALFLKADLLRHLGKYQESFEVLLSANSLRHKELEEKTEEWKEDNRKFQKEVRVWQAKVMDGADADAPKLLFILGPSRSGKTTIEFSIPENEVTKRGHEGRRASLAIKDLQNLGLEFNQHHQESSSEVAQHVIDSLFYRQAGTTNKIKHQLVTNTNPFLIKVAHIIFDLYPNSYFIFVNRDPIDTAADIFSTDYREPLQFAYHAQTARDYVNWYHAVSDELVIKMEGRALKISYADFIRNTELRVKSIAKFVGVDFEADRSQLDMVDRTDTSVYQKLFLEHLKKS